MKFTFKNTQVSSFIYIINVIRDGELMKDTLLPSGKFYSVYIRRIFFGYVII